MLLWFLWLVSVIIPIVVICYNVFLLLACRCLADCGTDAHRHVAHCPLSLSPGGLWGSPADFNAAHCERRRKEILSYIQSAVGENCRKDVLESIRKDGAFLGIDIK